MSSEINLLLEKASSPLLLDIDWDTTMNIVDCIRQGDVNAKAAIQAILNRLKHTNPNVVLLALQVFESVVKNCGQSVHEQVATRASMETINEVLRANPNDQVRKKILLLLATWVFAFRNEVKYRAAQDNVNILRAEGYSFPTVSESDAMFTADRAPDWADGECCHRCRSQFTMLRRKHHCRACGQVFCADCSGKYSTIPKFGIEREVRVCESCYDDVNNSQECKPNVPTPAWMEGRVLQPSREGQTTQDHPQSPQRQHALSPKQDPDQSSTNPAKSDPQKKTEEELQEEEELALAIALSKSDAENKEKEKLRATSSILGGNWRLTSPTSSPSAVSPAASPAPADNQDMDPELARYLNRSYWEQQQSQTIKQQQTPKHHQSQPESSLSPTHPSAPFNASKISPTKFVSTNKFSERLQNVEAEEVDEFVTTLRTQLEIFVNRMKSDQSRGRPIANDSSVQTLFMNITAMHAQLLKYIQLQDEKRVKCEQLQDKISQVRDARAALEALREEHRDRVRRQREEQERMRQIQMMQKLEIMRKKKQEYLEYQRQLALHRMAESERQIFSHGGMVSQGVIVGPPGMTGPKSMGPVGPFPIGYPPYGTVPGPMPGYMYPPESGSQQGSPQPPVQFQPGLHPGQSIQYQPATQGHSLPPLGPVGQTPTATQPTFQPSQEFSPFNMSSMVNNLPSLGVGGYSGTSTQGGAGSIPQMQPPQHMPPVQPATSDVPSVANTLPPPQEQAELISFD